MKPWATKALLLWRNGNDTARIAEILRVPEHEVANLIAAARDRKHFEHTKDGVPDDWQWSA